MNDKREITVNVPVLARVEGEGALDLFARDGNIERLQLRIFEPPRLFEKFLEGRAWHEVPDIVARICGICPVAYQMSASHAIESIFQVQPGPWVREMRRLFYCGEWIESHALHIHLLAAPDFLGYPSAIAMAKDYPAEVRRGLRLQEAGNALIRLFGGRSVHPVGARIGGFHRAPSVEQAREMLEKLKSAREDARSLVGWVGDLSVTDDDQVFTSVSLRHPNEYPMNEGRIVSSEGLDIDIADYEAHFTEYQQAHSTALHAHLHGKPYLVGPLARLNLNVDRLPPSVRDVLNGTGIAFPSRNMFHSALARAVEILYSVEEGIRILEDYRADKPSAPVEPHAGIGFGCTEAPRGLLWHRYEFDSRGDVVEARIVPPTSQNQARIEEDLRLSLQHLGMDRPDDEIRQHAETVIRNYDPCISCSTHFLRVRVERT